MDDRNYLNIAPRSRDGFIYRVTSVPRLFALFETKQNVLVKPKKWEDPFENFILRAKVRLQTGELAGLAFHDQIYGQCWTLHAASDAMWRIYSPKADAVRLRTTVRKLAESLSRTCGEWDHIEAFIGKVKYLPNKRLIRYANGVFKGGAEGLSSRLFAETLLVKRPAFAHEREVRLLFFRRDKASASDDLYPYSVDPHALIDQIMIDPRIPQHKAEELRDEIRTKTLFSGPVKRSLLYAAPAEMILPFG
jgi:hypothetical protein